MKGVIATGAYRKCRARFTFYDNLKPITIVYTTSLPAEQEATRRFWAGSRVGFRFFQTEGPPFAILA